MSKHFLKTHPVMNYTLILSVQRTERNKETLPVGQVLRRQAEQEASDETAGDDNVLLHKLCRLIYKRVELGARLLGALLKLLLSFVHILLYSLPVHLDVAGVVSNLQQQETSSYGCRGNFSNLLEEISYTPPTHSPDGDLCGHGVLLRHRPGVLPEQAVPPSLTFGVLRQVHDLVVDLLFHFIDNTNNNNLNS